MFFKHISTSVAVYSKINYFSHTEVLIIKVYRKKVLLIPPDPNWTIYVHSLTSPITSCVLAIVPYA